PYSAQTVATITLSGRGVRPMGAGTVPPLTSRALRLVSFPPENRLDVIRVVRQLTGLMFLQVNALVDGPLPAVIRERSSPEVGEDAADELRPFAVVDVVPVSLNGVVPEAPGPGPFELLLDGYPPDAKIAVIKVIRELTGIGLAEAKALSEAPRPVVVLRNL